MLQTGPLLLPLLHAANKLPVKVRTDLLPYGVVRDQPIPGLQQRKEHLILIQVQQLKELVQNIRVAQEVRAVVGTVQQKRCLDLLKHGSDLFLYFRGDGRRRISIQSA
jgi:hypothetical protein